MKRKRILRPISGMDSPRFTQISTFARLPHSDDLSDVDVVFTGIPFDDGTTYRTGAREGPSAIRGQSRLLRPYNIFQSIAPWEVLNVIDFGDVDVVPGYILHTYEKIEAKLRPAIDKKIFPMVAGGDHSVTLPVLRELNRVYGKVNLLHFDSHFDFWDSYWGEKYTHGTWLRRAIEENLLGNIAQAGIRGSIYEGEEDFRFAEKNHILVKTIKHFHEEGVKKVMQDILEKLGDGPLYVSWDIDVVDPAFAPGTGTPEVGGLSSWDAIECIRKLYGRGLIGVDIVEVSPLYDGPGQITALLAANLFYEVVSLVAKQRK
jgi:agmatinase